MKKTGIIPQMANQNKRRGRILTLAALAVILLLTYLINKGILLDLYGIRIISLCCIYGIAALAMNLVNGLTGQFSLGHAGFMALGAYITALLTIPPASMDAMYYVEPVNPFIRNLQAPFPIALILGGLVAAGFAFLIGFPVLRLKSDYLAIATLGFSEIIRVIIVNATSITNSSMGLKNVPNHANLWWCVGSLIVVMFLLQKLMRTSYGRTFKAIRDDEIAAQAMGVNLFKHKMQSFVISSFLAGISGGLLASAVGIITPPYFRFTLTYEILLIVVLGGMGSLTGSMIGAAVITVAKEWLRFLDDGFKIGSFEFPAISGMRMLAFSVMLMIVILFFREGLFGSSEFSWDGLFNLIKRIGRWLKKPFSKNSKGGEAV